MKQQIEIDVPDGCEVDHIYTCVGRNTIISFKKKQPEFIEVREYITHCPITGHHLSVIVKDHPEYSTPEETEKLPGFKRWIDHTWRKVEV